MELMVSGLSTLIVGLMVAGIVFLIPAAAATLQITVHRFQGAYNIRLRSNYKSKANDFINPEEQASNSLAAV